MMHGFVEVLRAAIFAVAHVCGGSLGAGVFLVSFGVRLALLPLTLRLARHARDRQRRLAELKPALDALRRQHASDPLQLMRATQVLHREHGIRLMSPASFVGLAVQLPVLGAMVSAVRNGLGAKVRFAWIADLARPDATLALGVAALSAAAVAVAPPAPGQTSVPTFMVVLATATTLAFVWSASSAFVLSAGAGSVVSVLQSWLLDRDATRARRAESAPMGPASG